MIIIESITPIFSNLEAEDYIEMYKFVRKNERGSLGMKDISYKHEEPIKIINMGDWHVGSKFTDLKQLNEDINYIANTPNVYTILTGDYIDNFGAKNSPPGGIYDQNMSPADAKKLVIKLIKKLAKKNKIIGVVDGCHDLWSKKIDNTQFAADMAEYSKTHWLGSYGNINIKVGDFDYNIYATHKAKGSSKYNVCKGLYDKYEEIDFDIAFGAHYHQFGIYSKYKRGKHIYCLQCSTYKWSDSYCDKNGYLEAKKRMPGVILSNTEKKITICNTMRDGWI